MTTVTDGRAAYARLVAEELPEEARIGFTLGFVRTFGVPAIARVLHGTGAMLDEPRARSKATGAAMFALIAHGVDGEPGRRIVERLRTVHRLPGITPELMRYVAACFTVCPLRAVDAFAHRRATPEERAGAYVFHRELSEALGLPGSGDVERWMAAFERREFAPSAEGRALWTAAARAMVAPRLPAAFAAAAPLVAAALLDAPLAAALTARRPPAPVRALLTRALRTRSHRHAPP